MVIPTGLHQKELIFEFRLNRSLVSEIIASKGFDKKLDLLACDFL